MSVTPPLLCCASIFLCPVFPVTYRSFLFLFSLTMPSCTPHRSSLASINSTVSFLWLGWRLEALEIHWNPSCFNQCSVVSVFICVCPPGVVFQVSKPSQEAYQNELNIESVERSFILSARSVLVSRSFHITTRKPVRAADGSDAFAALLPKETSGSRPSPRP